MSRAPFDPIKKISIDLDPLAKQEMRVVKIDTDKTPTVQAYSLPQLKKPGERDYRVTKERYGALAATDPDRMVKNQQASRFHLNPLLRNPLAIEDEERRVIDERVQAELQELAIETRQTAHDAGFTAGQELGRQQAFAEFKAECAEKLVNFQSMVSAFERAKAEIFQANERFLIDLVYRVGKSLFLKELSTDREYLTRLCRELIERVGVRENIRIGIHPQDLDSVKDLEANLQKVFGELRNLQIEPSSRVKQGGLILETEWNTIDASIETQLQGLYESLLGVGDRVTESTREGT